MILAPMAGVTDAAFRHVCIKNGCERAFCEMVSANALKHGSVKTLDLLQKADNEKRLSVQLFGGDGETVGNAAAELLEKYDIDVFDINMGCPMPKITKCGYGAALLLDVKRASEIVLAVKKAFNGKVGVKMRIGVKGQDVDFVAFAKAMENCGADYISVHGRTADQLYSGRADWNAIKLVKESVSVPVIGNGDVFTYADAVRMKEQTGCDDVLVARGAMGNPFIFAGEDDVSLDERIETALMHLELCATYKPEKLAILQMRKHIGWYVKGERGSSEVRARVNTCKSKEEIKDILLEYAQRVNKSLGMDIS